MTSLIQSFVFDRAKTNEQLAQLNGNVLAEQAPLNPLLLVFVVTLKDGQSFTISTNRWAAGHTEAFHAHLVLATGERLALPVSVPDEDKPMKRSYHDRWFAQYPIALGAALGLSAEVAQDLYDNVTRLVQINEPVAMRFGNVDAQAV